MGSDNRQTVALRIAWCTPFGEELTVGEYTASVVEELRHMEDLDVDILYPVGRGGRKEPDAGLRLDPPREDSLSDYDVVVYNIGDHWGYYGTLARLLRRVPGIVVLHSASLTQLVSREQSGLVGRDLGRALSRLYRVRGAVVAQELESDPEGWAGKPAHREDYPLFGIVLQSALAVVVHSEAVVNKVREEYAGDVWYLRLPSPAPQEAVTAYAREFLTVVQETGAFRRRRELATDLAQTLEHLGFAEGDEIWDVVAREVANLFGQEPVMAHEIYAWASTPA